jgi:hypothetical protein
MTHFTESVLEEAVLEYLGSLKWDVLFGPEIAPGEPALRDVLLPRLIRGEVRWYDTERMALNKF